MQTYLTKSGLVVAEERSDEAALQHELNRIDHPSAPRLVLTREIDRRHNLWVWNVHINWATDRPAVHVLTWRDSDWTPLPLSRGLIERTKERLFQTEDSIVAVDRANKERDDRLNREIDEASSDIAREVARFGAVGHSAVFPRSAGLAASRRRISSRGSRRK